MWIFAMCRDLILIFRIFLPVTLILAQHCVVLYVNRSILKVSQRQLYPFPCKLIHHATE